MPDQALLDAAEARQLSPAGPDLSAQVERMLGDPKSQGFIESFAGQWLSTRDAPSFVADETNFPGYDDELRQSLSQETNLFFRALIEESTARSAAPRDFTFFTVAWLSLLPDSRASGFSRVNPGGGPRWASLPPFGLPSRRILIGHLP